MTKKENTGRLQRRFVFALTILAVLIVPKGEATAKPTQGVSPLKYIEFTTGPDKAKATVTVIAIHGLGDSPANFARLYKNAPISARWIVPQAPLSYGPGYSWFPVRVPVEGHDPGLAVRLRRAAEKIVELIRYLKRLRPGMDRPIVTGFSQGGMLSFALAAHHDGDIRGSLPVAGALPPAAYPTRAPHIPILAIHGKADRIIPWANLNATATALGNIGARIEVKGFPGVGHSISPAMRQVMFEYLSRLMPKKPTSITQPIPVVPSR